MITPYLILLPLFRKAKESLMFVIWIWSLHELGRIWVSVVSYVLFLCSANEPYVVRHSKLRAGDGVWGIHCWQSSPSVPCPVAAHIRWVWMKIALSFMVYLQIPPCLGDLNHYLLASLWAYLRREEQDQLNEIWSSPSRLLSQLSRASCRLLPALMVFTRAIKV